jgi:hypothetical protein
VVEALAISLFAATTALVVYHVRRNRSQIKALEVRLNAQIDGEQKALQAVDEIAKRALQSQVQGADALSLARSLEGKVQTLTAALDGSPISEIATQITEISAAVTKNVQDQQRRHSELHTRLVVVEDNVRNFDERIDSLAISRGKMPEGKGL